MEKPNELGFQELAAIHPSNEYICPPPPPPPKKKPPTGRIHKQYWQRGGAYL
jgi:hypothetical protein